MAKYYQVEVVTCPAYSPQRKGVVEKFNHYLTQRWWRTARLTDAASAQRSLDRFCESVADLRRRPPVKLLSLGIAPRVDARGRYIYPKVGELAELEPLTALPPRPYPVRITTTRIVSPASLVGYQGNFYSVDLGRTGRRVTLTHHLSNDTIEITSPTSAVLGFHPLARAGLGIILRSDEHQAALSKAVLAASSPSRPHHPKANMAISLDSAERASELGDKEVAWGMGLGDYERLAMGGRRS